MFLITPNTPNPFSPDTTRHFVLLLGFASLIANLRTRQANTFLLRRVSRFSELVVVILLFSQPLTVLYLGLTINPFFHTIRCGDQGDVRGLLGKNTDRQYTGNQGEFAFERERVGDL